MSAAQRRLLLALLVLAVPASARAAPVVAGPPGGGPDRIIAAPSGGRVAYATTGGGLFRTRNGGRSWRLVPERLGTRLNLFAVDPSRASVVYASAGRSEAGERLVVHRLGPALAAARSAPRARTRARVAGGRPAPAAHALSGAVGRHLP